MRAIRERASGLDEKKEEGRERKGKKKGEESAR